MPVQWFKLLSRSTHLHIVCKPAPAVQRAVATRSGSSGAGTRCRSVIMSCSVHCNRDKLTQPKHGEPGVTVPSDSVWQWIQTSLQTAEIVVQQHFNLQLLSFIRPCLGCRSPSICPALFHGTPRTPAAAAGSSTRSTAMATAEAGVARTLHISCTNLQGVVRGLAQRPASSSAHLCVGGFVLHVRNWREAGVHDHPCQLHHALPILRQRDLLGWQAEACTGEGEPVCCSLQGCFQETAGTCCTCCTSCMCNHTRAGRLP